MHNFLSIKNSEMTSETGLRVSVWIQMLWKTIYLTFMYTCVYSFLNLNINKFELVVQLKCRWRYILITSKKGKSSISSIAQGILCICFLVIESFVSNTYDKFIGECLASFLRRVTNFTSILSILKIHLASFQRKNSSSKATVT